MQLTWTPNPDGEYNETTAEYKGHKLTVFSSRYGDFWGYYIDDDENEDYFGYGTEEEAKQAAIEDVASMT